MEKGKRIKVGGMQWLLPYTLYLLPLIFSCENSRQEIDKYFGKKTEIEEAINVQSLFSQNGKMKAKLWAPLMRRYHNDTLITDFPKTMHVNFFDSTGVIESHLDANTGKYFENLNKVHLRDSVVVFNTKGDTMWTPDLWWDQTAQRFFSDTVVIIHKIDGTRLTAPDGIDATQDLTDILLKKPVGKIPTGDSLLPK